MSERDDIPYGYCHCGCGAETNIAARNHTKNGTVKGQPYTFIKGHGARISSVNLTRREIGRRYRERDPARANANATKWRLANPERAKEVRRAFYQRHRERLLEERRARRWANREKELARSAVSNALMRGDLKKGSCEVGVGCRGRMEAHHADYAKPLEVRWLCGHHHAELHCA